MRNPEDLILIRTNHAGYIPELATSGPIVSHIYCSISRVMRMLSAGLKVFEIEPKTGKTVELTVINIDRTDLFGDPQIPVAETKFNIGNPIEPTRVEVPHPLVEEKGIPLADPMAVEATAEIVVKEEAPVAEPEKPVVTTSQTNKSSKKRRN